MQAVYQVQAGRVLLRRDEARGGSITLQTAGPGDFVAEASLFSAIPLRRRLPGRQ
ncbi:TPA: cyclic nucleotide-binding domain-containing protein [Burkholderia cenocepacia]|uniref:cyclic nucleotide-binding domain-containing protein n=1 Tax=Burkholderia cenocepacia TaxID=95486 RepID=UPI001F4B4844|nr:cyclic nucleotide-binding domain-containing protein [Burkholderia cenocepacia]MDN7541713.1 cyclic nucleotide-binding domain-containing protein [Burkholderia cenocepacia]MDR5647334.1 cyclic nucleotide-binding domain-containing protein [Burkholderia cenocepacia]MDS0805082.1 cyclic nucleotide-binding domain-containing protein [Burkholderia cenocepacia]